MNGESTLDMFHEWFTAASVALGHTEDSEIRRFVDSVDGLFIRLSEDELSEDEFGALLRQLAGTTVEFVMSDDYHATTHVHTSFSSNTTEEEKTLQAV